MTDDDLEALLRQADPAANSVPLTSLRITDLLEDTMSTDIQTTPHTPAPASVPARRRVGLLVAASAALLLAVGGFVAQSGFGHSPASATKQHPSAAVTQLTVGAAAKCAVPTSEVLATVQVAFEGTVRSIDGGVVTLVPSKFFAGPTTDTVTLTQTDGRSDVLLGGANTFEIGSRYLVAATDGQVQACYSGEATAELQSLYDATF
jgi:hypothetical protein